MAPQEGESSRLPHLLPREGIVFLRDHFTRAKHTVEEQVATPFIVNKAIPRLEQEAIQAPITYEDGFDDELARCLLKGGRPMILSGHQSHADIFYTAAFANAVLQKVNTANADTPYEGFYVPVAESLRSGGQGDLLYAVYGKLQHDLPKQHVIFGEFARKKDREYGVERQRERNELLGRMLDAQERNYGIALYPEGTVEQGRRKKGASEINGFQQVGRGLNVALRKLLENDSDLIIIPMASHGTYELYDPTTKRPVTKSIAKLLLNQPLDVVIKAGKPFLATEMYEKFEEGLSMKEIGERVDMYVMSRVAALYPPEVRGPYPEIYLL